MSERSVTATPAPGSAAGGDRTEPVPVAGRAVGPSGRYVLGALLGRGGMAEVYQAHDQALGRDVAVKLLRDPAPEDDETARFVAEARTLARLSHPNLVSILDAGISDDEHPFLVLELVAGSSLARGLAAADQAWSPTRVASLGAQIAAALEHCHAAGIVHRDVKPDNILLDTGDRALLTDFGISRLLDSPRHTQTGFTIGTASYMAPEQVHGDEITPAVDMYSLGLVLLEACTGHREYPGSPLEAAIARLHRSPQIPSHLPPALGAVLAALTDADPTARPTAGEAGQALTGFLTGETADDASALPTEAVPRFVASASPASAGGRATSPETEGATKRRRRGPALALITGTTAVAAAAAAAAVALVMQVGAPENVEPSTGSTDSTSRADTPAAATPSPSARSTTAADVAGNPSTAGSTAAKPRPKAHHADREKTRTDKPDKGSVAPAQPAGVEQSAAPGHQPSENAADPGAAEPETPEAAQSEGPAKKGAGPTKDKGPRGG